MEKEIGTREVFISNTALYSCIAFAMFYIGNLLFLPDTGFQFLVERGIDFLRVESSIEALVPVVLLTLVILSSLATFIGLLCGFFYVVRRNK